MPCNPIVPVTVLQDFSGSRDGTRETGEKVNHKFAKSGEYDVRLGLILKSETSVRLSKIGY